MNYKLLTKTSCIFVGIYQNTHYIISIKKKDTSISNFFKGKEIKHFSIDEVRELFLNGFLLNELLNVECVFDKGFFEALINIPKLIQSLSPEIRNSIDFLLLCGSSITGNAKKHSDIDIMIVFRDMSIDMTVDELKTEIKSKKLNFDPLVLFTSDAWVEIRNVEALPMNFLENGLSIVTSPTIKSWSVLLKKGQIFPSKEAISIYYEQSNRSFVRLKEQRELILNEILYWSVIRLAQALFMDIGKKLPVPNKLYLDFKKLFVDEKKLFSLEDIRIIKNVIKIKYDLKHRIKTDISFEELAKLENELEIFHKKVMAI